MSSKQGAGKAIELVERLRSVISDAAAREEDLERDFLVRINKERERREAATGGETRALTAALEEAEAAFQAAREAASAGYTRRKARINKGRGTSKELGIERVDARMGTRKYELQKQMLQAERSRDAGLAAAAQTRADFDHLLALELAALTPLEQSAQQAFKGYGRFRLMPLRRRISPRTRTNC